MQTSSDNGEGNPDDRGDNMEDSPLMTIEYLRARLLSERLVSKAAKDRVEELAKQVEELEEQLEIVTFQRKRAEKATIDILSVLASQGIGDISEYESESDEEGSLCESNEGKCDATEEADNVSSLQLKGNDTASCSDRTTSSGRALSWNGRKDSARLSDRKPFDSSIKRQTRFPLVGSTQRHRPGKSCRQIRRREMRAIFEESRHEYAKLDAQDNKTSESSANHTNGLDADGEELTKSDDKRVEIVLRKGGVRLSLTLQEQESNTSSPIPNHRCNGDMEKALEHQAQLIGCNEAQEKAQRDWEEKYGDNDISTLDSCEPGNHSDVTEERDDNNESVCLPTEFVACHGHEVKAEGSRSQSQASDLLFSTGNNYQAIQGQERGVAPSFQLSAQSCPHFSGSSSSSTSSPAGSSMRESERSENPYRHHSLVAKEESQTQTAGMILGVLQEAKLLIKEQMDLLPATNSRSVGIATETSISRITDSDWLKVPVGCSGLFRVPTNIQPQFPTESRLLDSGYSSELTNTLLHSRALGSQGDGSTLGFTSNSGQSSSNLASPAFPSFPDSLPSTSTFNQMSYSPFMRTEVGIPPSRIASTFYQGHDVRQNLSRQCHH